MLARIYFLQRQSKAHAKHFILMGISKISFGVLYIIYKTRT